MLQIHLCIEQIALLEFLQQIYSDVFACTGRAPNCAVLLAFYVENEIEFFKTKIALLFKFAAFLPAAPVEFNSDFPFLEQKLNICLTAENCLALESLADKFRMTLTQLQQRYIRKPKKHNTRRRDLQKSPQKKGTCLKVFVTTPRKPNSALRKVARVLLSNSFRITAYIPGMSHNLQKHSVVLVRGGRVKDLPGVRYTTIRGQHDLQRLAARRRGRSKYGTPAIVKDHRRGPYYKVKI